jgi:predicted ATPase
VPTGYLPLLLYCLELKAMSIAGAYLRGFEPFKDQSVEFKSKASQDLADVHFFVGQNGTGKTRLLSLLASACGNPEELKFRTSNFSSVVIGRAVENGAETFQMFSAPHNKARVMTS